MRHVEDDTLTLVALGEVEPDAAAARHLATCEQCREELAALTAVVSAGRAAEPLVAPAPHVWDRIAQEIASTTADPARPSATTAPGRRGPGGSTRPAGRRERPRGRLARAAWLAAGIAAGIAGTLVVTNLPGTQEEPVPVAQAQLDPLPGWQETGSARLEEADGRLLLRVEVSGEESDGFREVWLLDEDVQQLVSVGLLAGNEGVFDLPEGLDLDELVLVDVSREPFDGDPAHSGDSIVRGRLTT
ncbi:anti-sigma factor [Georgenia satyanarayanai]|uniref:anti-sigma factor n=1 Tax=Georgenia satyanarayanai TaxID=860221 RepID=UPI0020400BFB|nr:anti-sigma factor [Georgenia satyanarayanai]MCM3660296.1 anti-sigma factor [Georgenia satyanarayanai]